VKFLFGVLFGVLCAVGVMMFPEAREAVFFELDLQTQDLRQIARSESLQSIKASFLDESVYTDLVSTNEQPAIEQEDAVAQVLWADQIAVAKTLPLVEPDIVFSTPVPVNTTVENIAKNVAEAEDVQQANKTKFEPVFAAVWSPFRSERSALGFASTLSARLDRPFRVVRLAAGRYEVGFDSSSKEELLIVLDAVLDITSAGPGNLQVSL